ncbi:hypothetical protein GNI_136710 [Gregarina niphandrodes]|uniref:Uncharacterized protein n=1 Tax=Gregarina niphandrodes TaxID=110365 RepID=A0A023B1D8_GRENI|nr:hypothetical protein GNI_136710 [Gregarina niphandrodes]EZG45802.1 hypothetical protein GNI_136710 [Gregarina niphandrodes]|eukprot:XP_011132439.1 hypothetical protein GNI_136710 [Gregarina niphandrodes]
MAAEPEIIALLDKFMTTSGIPNRVSADEVCRDGAPDGAPVDVVSEGPVRAPWLLILLHIARKYNLTVNSTEGEQESINKFANAELERLSHSVDPRCRKAAKINKFWLTQEVAAEQLCGMLQTKKNRKLWNEELGGLDSQLLSVLHIFTEIGRLPYGGLLPENHDCDRDIYVELNETIAALVKRDFERLESLTPASAIPFVKKSWKYLRDQGYGGLGTVRLSLNSTDPTSSTNRTSSTDPTSSTDRTSSTDPMSSNDRTSSTDRPPLSDLASSLHAVMKDIDFRGDTSDAVIINDHPNHELSHVLTTVPPPSLKGAVILGLAMMNDPQLIVPRQGVLQQIVLGSDQARTDCRQRSTPGQTSERERGFTLGLVEYEAALRHACLEVCEEAKIDHCVVDWAVERATLDVTKMDPVLQPTQSGILGGLVTTEILKSITRQFTPFHGTLVFDPFTTHTLMIPYV